MPFKDPKKRKEYDREHKREIRKKFPEKTREIQKKSYEKNRKKILEHQKQQRKTRQHHVNSGQNAHHTKLL